MATLAETMIGNQQQAMQNSSHTAGDAIQAFHIAATAEHARQELEMEQQKQEVNKAQWMTSMMEKIGKLDGPAQDMMIDTFGRQAKKIEPTFNTDNLDILKKDPELADRYSAVAAKYANAKEDMTPDDMKYLRALHGSAPDAFINEIDKAHEYQLQKQGAELKAQSFQGRVQTQQDNQVMQAGDRFDKDPNLLKLVPMGQTLGRDLRTLTSNARPTYQTLHEMLMSGASVLGSGTLSDARVSSITPPALGKTKSEVEQLFTSDPDQPADAKYVKYVKDFIDRLHTGVRAQVADRSDTLFAGKDQDLFHNQNMVEMAKRKRAYYSSGAWENAGVPAGIKTPQAVQATEAQATTPTAPHPVDSMNDDQVRQLYNAKFGGK